MKKLILIFIGLFFIGFSANAGPITFNVYRGIEFPEFVPDTNGGTIERYRGKRNISGIAQFVNNGRDSRIQIRGDDNEEFEVEIVGTSSLTEPGSAMLVHDFQVRDGPTFTLSSSGRFTIRNIGGQLDYAIGQTAGSYNGSIQIRVRYTSGGGWYYETIPMTAEISAQTILIQERDELNFGQVIPDASGGVIAMDSAGNMSNVSGSSTFHGGHQRGLFRIGGQANSVVYISIPDISLTKGADTLDLFDIECNKGTSFTLTSNGQKYIRTFGKIDIPASPIPGIYTGTYDVIVNY